MKQTPKPRTYSAGPLTIRAYTGPYAKPAGSWRFELIERGSAVIDLHETEVDALIAALIKARGCARESRKAA